MSFRSQWYNSVLSVMSIEVVICIYKPAKVLNHSEGSEKNRNILRILKIKAERKWKRKCLLLEVDFIQFLQKCLRIGSIQVYKSKLRLFRFVTNTKAGLFFPLLIR